MPSSPRERRFFLCSGEVVEYKYLHMYPDSHIIGELFHVIYEGERVTACFYYLTPVSTIVVPPVRPEYGPRMIEADVDCRFPGCRRRARWKAGKTAQRIISNRFKSHLETDESIHRKNS